MSCPQPPTTFVPNAAKSRRLFGLCLAIGGGSALLTPILLSQGDVRGYVLAPGAVFFLYGAYITWARSSRVGLLIDCQGITDSFTYERPYTVPWENVGDASTETRHYQVTLTLLLTGPVEVEGRGFFAVIEAANRLFDGRVSGVTPMRIYLAMFGESAEEVGNSVIRHWQYHRHGSAGRTDARTSGARPSTNVAAAQHAHTPAHDLLGVEPGATPEEVAQAYRRMAMLYHPDRVSGLADEFKELADRRMKEINAAYNELKRHG